MKIFKLLLMIIITLLFTIEVAYSADNCNVDVNNTDTFSSVSDVYVKIVPSLVEGQHNKYYFNITTAGTLTITADAPADKIKVAYSDTACPTALITDSHIRTVTVTGPTDINVDLVAKQTSGYTITVTFIPSPLGISKTNTPLQMPINTPTNVLYTLSVKNYNTTEDLSNVRVTDTLPAGVTISSIEDNISATGWNCSASSVALSKIDCTLSGSLNANASREITISTMANSATAQNIINTARVDATGGGSWSAVDSSTLAAVSGAGTVDLEIQKFASSDVIPPNTDFAYLIFVINYDNDDAQLVKVTDTFPAIADGNISFINAGGNGWTCTTPTDANRTFVCNYDQPLAKGITYFLVNAHTGANEVANVSNTATVSALNTINYNHSVTDDANITISIDGSSGSTFFTGYYPQGGYIEVSDIGISNRANAQIWTKIAATQDTTFPVYFVNPDTGAVTDYNGTTQNVPLVIVFKLTDDTCSATNETYLSYDSTKSVIAEFDNGYGPVVYAKTAPDTTFDLRNIAKKNSRLLMKYVNIQELLDASGESCSNSNLSANIKGLPQCIANSTGGSLDNNKYINVFGIDAFVRCAIGNGQPCTASKGGVGDEPYNTEYGCYECTVGGLGYCSKNNFAIRPNEFNSSLTLNQQFQAGADSAITFYANNFVGSGTTDYNESEIASPPSFAVDLNISDSTKACAQPNLHFGPTGDGVVVFSDGLAPPPYKIINVGDFNVTMHEINGSEFALVDVDDTPDLQRFITPFTQQIKVVPHHFGLDGNYTNAGNGFTYLSNFEEYNTTASREMSASLDMNITAQADNNTTTTNYTENCYAKDGNLNVGITPFTVSPTGSLSKMIWYDINHDTNGSIPLPLPGTISIPILHTAFDNNESNGTSLVNYLINFDRNQTKLVNPFSVTVGNVDMNDSDSVTGTKVMNTSAYFVYGRIIPRDIRVFGSNAFDANGWYEVFGTTSIGTTALPVSKNDNRWATNRLHEDLSDGDSNVTRMISSGASDTVNYGGNDALGVEVFGFPAITPTYNGKAHVDTAPWLWFAPNALTYSDPSTTNPANAAGNDAACLTHPCFNVTVMPAIGATGSAKDTNEDTKASKTSTSGGGGWRSTTDYAPAIR